MIAIDNNGQEYPIINCGDTYIVENSDISMSRRYIDIKSDLFEAEKDDEGYYVIADANKNGSRLVRFKERKDGEPISHGANPNPHFRVDGSVTAQSSGIASVQCGYGNTAPFTHGIFPTELTPKGY